MNDIELARKVLKQEDCISSSKKMGEIVFKSKDKGMQSLCIYWLQKMKELSKGGSLADRVIGKGAALLCRYIGIEEVYTELISEGGINTLEKYKIPYIMEKSCPYIKIEIRQDTAQ